MPRATIILPDNYIFSTEISIRISDINYGNHLANDALLSIIHEARVQFLKSLGYTEKNINDIGIIMVDSVIIYKRQAFYGDQLRLQIAVDDISKRACDLIYLVQDLFSDKEIARAKTRIAFFDYVLNKTTNIPQDFIQVINKID